MLRIIALRGTPRIQEMPFDQIQEWLNGVNPMSPHVKSHDSGKPREVIPDLSPAGPDGIVRETGDKSSMDNVSSGYDRGMDPGGRADDETGPGNTSNKDQEQNYPSSKNIQLFTRQEGDTSSNLFLNEDSSKRDRPQIQQNMSIIYGMPPTHRRWQHSY